MKAIETAVTAEEWLEKALAAAEAGKPVESRNCLESAVAQEPENGALRLACGHVRLSIGQLQESLDDYDAAVCLLPNQSNAHSSRALALQLLQKTELAHAEAHCALALNVTDNVALKVMARIRLNHGRKAEAHNFCKRVLAVKPEDADALAMIQECGGGEAAQTDALSVLVPRVSLPQDESIEDLADADWQEEIAFWDNELTLKGTFAQETTNKLHDPEKVFPKELLAYIGDLRSRLGRIPRALDAGSGPLPYLAYGHQKGLLNLVGADPLAEVYLKLLAKHGHKPTAPLVRCSGEELTKVFGEESFDFIYMRNALDHSQSPAEVIRQMVKALRPGGYIFIVGTVKEATRQKWAGLHQHNLYLESGGRLMDEHRKPGSKELVTECISDGLGLETVESIQHTLVPGDWMSVLWRKCEQGKKSDGKAVQLIKTAQYVGNAWKEAPYYDEAEQRIGWEWSDYVWPIIQGSNFSIVMDLAAGHGRNSEKLRSLANQIYIVDINEENIAFCRQRFAGNDRFVFIQNNGATLDQIPDNTLTFVYCFDAMVHFDSDVVRSYLGEFRRILKPGGRGFCHHSNTTKYPGGDVHQNPGWRNFMSKEMFAHYCVKEGLHPIKARVIDWGGRPGSDCLSLFEKR